jgi:hypothetical protein
MILHLDKRGSDLATPSAAMLDNNHGPKDPAVCPEGAAELSPGFHPREQTPPRSHPHQALLRCALGKNTRRARVGAAEGVQDRMADEQIRRM